jgi:phosphatidylglycerophosphatase A
MAVGAPRRAVARAIATLGGLGERLPAPGTTVGSPAAVVGFAVLIAVVPPGAPRLWVSAAVLVVVCAAGVWAAGVEARRRGAHDPGPVVVDEVAGQWLALAVAWRMAEASAPRAAPLVAVAFVAFRLLDVVKPWPISRLESLPGGLGIMADDLLAGLLAGLLTGGAWLLLPP